MNTSVILALSVVLQLCAAGIALRLVRITQRRFAWGLISVAITLMAVRRAITLYHVSTREGPMPDLSAELVALGISVLMIIGLALVVPLFHSIQASEEALRESEQRYRQLAEAALEGIIVHEDGRVVDTNPAFGSIFGYEPGEALGLHIDRFIAQDSKDLVLKRVQEGYDQPFEHEAIHKDGSRFPAQVSGKSIRFGDRVVRVTAIQDITERKEAEASLRLTQLAIDRANEPVYWVNEHGRFQYVNEAACRSLGYTKEELLECAVSDIDPNYPPGAWDSTWEELLSKESSYFESVHTRKDGTSFPVEIHANILRFEGGVYVCAYARDISERRRAEDELRESQRALETLFSNLPGMAYRCRNDRDWTMEFVSEGCVELTGYSPGDLHFNNVISYADLIHPEDTEEVWDQVQAGVAGRQQFTFMYRIRTATNEEKWVWEQGRGVFDKDGALVALEGFILDITDQKLAEESLQRAHGDLEERVRARTAELTASNERLGLEVAERRKAEEELLAKTAEFEAIFKAVPDIYFRLGADGTIRSYQAGSQADLFVPPSEFLGKRMGDVLPPDVGRKIREAVERVSRVGELVTVDYELEIAGAPRFFEARLLPLGTDQIIMIVRDITRRQRSASALRESESRFRSLSEAAPIGIFLTDSAGKSVYANEYLLEISGLSLEQALGDGWFRSVHPEDADRVVRETSETAKRGRSYVGQFRVQRPDGIVRWVDVRTALMRDENGNLIGKVGTVQDITDRREAEEDLKKAKEIAESANRAKSSFLANLSHEIRTPITALLAAAELLVARTRSDGDYNYTDPILRNGRHLLALVDDLLDVSQADAGHLEVHPTSCSLTEIMADVIAVTRPLYDRPGVEYRLIYATPIPKQIRTDPIRLKQAIINLATNALKFTAAGHIHICISVFPKSPEPRLRIAVEDTGLGIADPDLDRIFHAFTQVGPRRGDVSGGVGLGLTLAQWISVQLGGSIRVQSDLGRGSTFTLEVSTGPLEDAEWIEQDELPGDTAIEMAQAPPEASPIFFGRILLADDFSDTRRLIQESLSLYGATVVVAEDGEQAVRFGLAESFDLILMDLRMPRMDGVTATKKLRESGCLIPIIALTASTTQRDREEVLKAGFDDLWTKPIALKELVKRIAPYMRSDPASEQPPNLTETGSEARLEERLLDARIEFMMDLPDRLRKLQTAIQSADLVLAGELLHQLVGVFGIHGFGELSGQAAALLALATKGQLAEITEKLEAFEELAKAARKTTIPDDELP